MAKPAKIAQILEGKKFLVHDVEKGWLDGNGSPVQPHASQRHTKWYPGLTEAKLDGFSPTAAQAAVIAKWDTAKPAPKPEAKAETPPAK